MASLDSILRDALVIRAAPRSPLPPRLALYAPDALRSEEPFLHRCKSLADTPVVFADAPEQRPLAEGEPLWSWWAMDPEPARMLDITCRVPAEGVPFHELMVCRDIEWRDVRVTVGDREITLPLHTPFVLRKYVLEEGFAPACADALFPLEADLDASALCVFGFELAEGSSTPEPLSAASCLDEGFMPQGDELSASGPLRIVVAVELACEKPRRGLDPWHLLYGARLRPHLLLRASRTLEAAEATVLVRRNNATVMIGCFADLEDAYRGRAEAGMAATLVSFADASGSSATWDTLFTDVAVDAGAAGWVSAAAAAPAGLRRGAFDGALIAPRVRAPERLVTAYPGWKLRHIVPAPVGDHDALHVFWRFPERFGQAPCFAGWDAEGPCHAAGAPMIPPNQEVRVRTGADGDFEYHARLRGPMVPGRFQVVMHHGLVFGLALEVDQVDPRSPSGELCALPEVVRAPTRDVAHWRSHWERRYRSSPHGPVERLSKPSPANSKP